MTGGKHPMVAYGERRGWDRRKTAAHFSVAYGRFRKVAVGWEGASYETARRWAERSDGEFSATDVLSWQSANRRVKGDPSDGGEAARAAG